MKLPILLGIVILILIISPSSAVVPINVVDAQCDYILWGWFGGPEVLNAYVDGQLMCGYDTNDSYMLVSPLSSGEIHNITVYFVGGDIGTNDSYTESYGCDTGTVSYFGYGNDTSAYIIIGVAIGLLLTIIYLRRKTP